MAPDRDLAVAFVRAWSTGAPRERDGWEALAGTGVRGLRLLHEGRAFRAMRLTELRAEAVAVLEDNARRYPGASAERRDARRRTQDVFDYVDLDPYGTPVPFLPTGLAAVRPGGVLAVTATDMMVLAGVQRGAAERRYGGRAVRGRLGPEGGLRLLLAHVARVATDQGRSTRPLLAYARDHYVRAYLEVSGDDDRTPPPVRAIDPSTWQGPPLGETGPVGPLWSGPLFDPALVGRMEVPETAAEPTLVRPFLERLREEAAVDVPFYYESNSLARRLGLARPPSLRALLDELHREGYRAGRTHARPEGFRTDAPRPAVESIARKAADQSQNARVRA